MATVFLDNQSGNSTSLVKCDLVNPIANQTITVTFSSAPAKVLVMLTNSSVASKWLLEDGAKDIIVGWTSGTATYSKVSLTGKTMTVVGHTRVTDFIYIAFK